MFSLPAHQHRTATPGFTSMHFLRLNAKQQYDDKYTVHKKKAHLKQNFFLLQL